ncbi:unnamed protein product, partial [Prorocentrum cordatum]
ELVAAVRADIELIEIAGYTLQQALDRFLTTLTGAPLAPPEAGPPPAGAPKGAPAAAPAEAAEDARAMARDLVTRLSSAAAGVKPAIPGSSVSFDVQFKLTVPDARTVAERLRDFHGPAGPPIPVQILEEEAGRPWRRQAASAWSAEKGGDSRLLVLRLRIPCRSSLKKNTGASAQWSPTTNQVVVKAVKLNITEYAARWVAAFGPVNQVSPSPGSFIPTGAAPPPGQPSVAARLQRGAAAARRLGADAAGPAA